MIATMPFVALSGAGVLAVALLVTLLLGKASASLRHLVWTAALAALLVLSVLEISGLRLEVPVPAPLLEAAGSWGAGNPLFGDALMDVEPLVGESLAPDAVPVDGPSAAETAVNDLSPGDATEAADVGPRVTGTAGLPLLDGTSSGRGAQRSALLPNRTAGGLLAGVWVLGCLFFLGMTLFSQLAARRLTVRGVRRPSSSTRRRFARLSDELGIARPVRLVVSSRIRVPATWGLGRSTVLLPADFESWPRETLDRALLHELAHVRRRDCWSYLLASLARAVHWPNPLVWVALRCQRLESERACDDHVLVRGDPASAYAKDLVAMARALRAEARLPRAAMAMAGQSEVSGRVHAILDPTRARYRVGGRTVFLVCALAVGLATAVPLVTPVAVAQDAPVQQAGTAEKPTIEASVGPILEPTLQVEPVEPDRAPSQPPAGPHRLPVQDTGFQLLQSEHFDWHFSPEDAEAAEDAIAMGERRYEELARFLQHEVEGRTSVILTAERLDLQSGDRVVAPFAGSYEDTDRVLGHELVHTFQYDIARSRDGGGLRGLGALPLWHIEGMAEYLSLERDDAHTAMWIRDAIRRDDFPTIRQMTREPRIFPYRFGQALWAYVGDTYGDAAIAQIYRSSLRVGFEGAVQQVLGMDVPTLSREWRDDAVARYLPLLENRTAPQDQGNLLLAPSTGSGPVNVAPSLSPDGRHVAFLSEAAPFSVDLLLADAVTGRVIRTLSSPGSGPQVEAHRDMATSGTWSPDSRFFAHVAVVDGDHQIVVVNIDDGVVTRRLGFAELGIGAVGHAAWSPDGRHIAFSGSVGSIRDLYVHDLESAETIRLTNDKYADLQPAWSPDGRTLAFVSDRGPGTDFERLTYGNLQLSLLDMRTRDVRVLSVFGDAKHINPQYSPDGASLYFVSEPDGFSDIFELDLQDESVRRITTLATGVSGHTQTAPALSVAASGLAAFSVFDQFEFHIYTVDLSLVRGTGATPESQRH